MQSRNITLLVPEGSPGAALWVRRAGGRFALEKIDARVANAVRVAAAWRPDADAATEPTSGAFSA